MVLVDSHGISRVPRYSGTRRKPVRCHLPGSHRLWPIVPDRSTRRLVVDSLALKPDRPYNPTVHARWFGLFRVRSPLLAESLYCFLFLQVLRWFTSLRCLPRSYVFRAGYSRLLEWVSPLGNPRVKACLRLTGAYRSLPRPSSTAGAKAFTVRP